jgi:hypothetical protein
MWNSACSESQVGVVKEAEDSAMAYGKIIVDKREVTSRS